MSIRKSQTTPFSEPGNMETACAQSPGLELERNARSFTADVRRNENMKRDVVLLLLFDNEGRFLLQHRDQNAPAYPGYWGFFGGGIEASEKPMDALFREAFEELRYTPHSTEPTLSIDYNDPKSGRFGRKHYFTELCPDKTSLELHEGQNMAWFNLAEASKLRISEGSLLALEEILKRRSEPVRPTHAV